MCPAKPDRENSVGLCWMAKQLESDELWMIIEPLLPLEPPKPNGGRPRVPDRVALAGIIFVLKSGIPWGMLPKGLGFGSGVTCWEPYCLGPRPRRTRTYRRPTPLPDRYGRNASHIPWVGRFVPALRAAHHAQHLPRLKDESVGYVPFHRLVDDLLVAAHRHARSQFPRQPARANLH